MIETEVKKKITLEEFMQLPDENIELINGQIVQEPTPVYGHQKISVIIASEIYAQLKDNNRGDIIAAPMDVILGENVLQPDLLFIAAGRLSIAGSGRVVGPPDVVFEIISPSNAYRDTKEKFDLYEQFGVEEYFIVYPDDKMVVKYALSDGKYHEAYRETGIVKSEIIGCDISF
ncbi:MAG TPA: Uma2 family endonuclease [Chitinophagales bacterium]|nr:Uma2 family endonuclease [Chitinophagales bacterium]